MIPDEIDLVKLIFNKFIETGSLTKTDQFLMEGKYKTKRGNTFTRFAIKGILSNPVYMIADNDAYAYLVQRDVDLFSEKQAFDGKHGIMAYNRTLQRRGKATQEKPMNEWIVSVGKHKGVIPGAIWIRVQNLLELNKSKSYRKPRSNTALLSGVLYCSKCGDYMRPKLTDRLNSNGEPIYTYLCTTKERSRSHVCDMKNANGNMLDAMIIEQIKGFGKQSYDMAKQIMQLKRRIHVNCEGYDTQIAKLKSQIDNNDQTIRSLVVSLGKSEGTHAEKYIIQQIDELHVENEKLKIRLDENQAIMQKTELTEIEFDLIKQLLSSVGESIDDYSVEQKRAAIRSFIRRIVWDGKNAHVYLFHGDGDCEFHTLPSSNKEPLGEDSE